MLKLPEGPYKTKEDLVVLYNKYNKLLFDSKCPSIQMKIQKETGKGLAWAKLSFEQGNPVYTIRFNRAVLNGAFSRVQLILIHEMIHIYLYKIGMDYYNEYNRIDGSRYCNHQHGPLFLEQTRRIKGITGLTITVIENDFEIVELDSPIYFVALRYMNNMFYIYQVPKGKKLLQSELDAIVAEARTKTSEEMIQKIEYRKTKNSLISMYPELTAKHSLHSKKKLKWMPEDSKYSPLLNESELIKQVDLAGTYGTAPDWVKTLTASKSYLAARQSPFPDYVKFMLKAAETFGYVTLDKSIDDWVGYCKVIAGDTGFNLLLETWKSYTVDQLLKDEKYHIEKIFSQMEEGLAVDHQYFENTQHYFTMVTMWRISEQELYSKLFALGLKTSLVTRKDLHKYLSFITGYKGQS
jgi:hypothetical protein